MRSSALAVALVVLSSCSAEPSTGVPVAASAPPAAVSPQPSRDGMSQVNVWSSRALSLERRPRRGDHLGALQRSFVVGTVVLRGSLRKKESQPWVLGAKEGSHVGTCE
jgi:hypothetical protein